MYYFKYIARDISKNYCNNLINNELNFKTKVLVGQQFTDYNLTTSTLVVIISIPHVKCYKSRKVAEVPMERGGRKLLVACQDHSTNQILVEPQR